MSPCPSFQRPECVAASQAAAFPLGDRKGGEGCSKEREDIGEVATGHTASGRME